MPLLVGSLAVKCPECNTVNTVKSNAEAFNCEDCGQFYLRKTPQLKRAATVIDTPTGECARQEFWSYENIACPPAVQRRSMEWAGNLTTAYLHVEMIPHVWWGFVEVKLNSNTVWIRPPRTGPVWDIGRIDIAQFLKKGSNTLWLSYDHPLICQLGTTCYAYIDFCSDQVVEPQPPTQEKPFWQDLALWGGVVVIGGVAAYAGVRELVKKI